MRRALWKVLLLVLLQQFDLADLYAVVAFRWALSHVDGLASERTDYVVLRHLPLGNVLRILASEIRVPGAGGQGEPKQAQQPSPAFLDPMHPLLVFGQYGYDVRCAVSSSNSVVGLQCLILSEAMNLVAQMLKAGHYLRLRCCRACQTGTQNKRISMILQDLLDV
jgi:hypothetical protein